MNERKYTKKELQLALRDLAAKLGRFPNLDMLEAIVLRHVPERYFT